jgi:hypothetical protein
MSVNILNQLKDMTSNPSRNSRKSASTSRIFSDNMLVKHTHADDIESVFYVLVWIMIMYNGPLSCERPEVYPERTILGPWINGDATAALIAAGDAKSSFIIMETRRKDFHDQVSPYFRDLLPLVDQLRRVLAKNMITLTTDPVTFQDVLPIFDEFLSQMPAKEKPSEMMRVVQGVRSGYATLPLIPPLHSEQNKSSRKRLSQDVRSMDDPPVPFKRFKRLM